MKKLVALLLALVMMLGVCSAMADNIKMDKLTLEFVPSKDADVIITGTKNLPELLKAEMAKQGYDIGEIEITVGTNYNATGEAMGAGSIDVGWLPPSTYVLYSDEVDVILTSTRAGLSNDSHSLSLRQGTGCESQCRRKADLGRPEQGQLGCRQQLLFCRIHLSDPLAHGKL